MKRLLYITRFQLISLLIIAPLCLSLLSHVLVAQFIHLDSKAMIALFFGVYTTMALLAWCATIVHQYAKLESNKVKADNRYFFAAFSLAMACLSCIPLLSASVGIIGNDSGPTAMFISSSSLSKIIPWLLIEIACIVYCFSAVDRIITRNTEETSAFDDNGARLLALMLFFPLGVWMTQPLVNEVFKNKKK